jgi:hypothetical protein
VVEAGEAGVQVVAGEAVGTEEVEEVQTVTLEVEEEEVLLYLIMVH